MGPSADLYALGVLLYELLVGVLPFESQTLRQVGYDAVRRIICEEEPPRPSTRFSSLGDGSAVVAAAHGCAPRRLQSALRGDLASIILFGGLLAWAVVEVIVINKSEPDWTPGEPGTLGKDAMFFVASIVLLAWALRERLRGEVACRLDPAATSTSMSD